MELTIKKETAQKIYPESAGWFQKVLVETFGEKAFKPKNFRDIKTFNDVCLENGTTEQEFNDRFENLGLDLDTIIYEKMKLMVKAINQGWIPDINNTNQRKWYPYFDISASGLGFSDSDSHYAHARTAAGSRLCFETEEKSNYAGTQFIEIYQQFIL